MLQPLPISPGLIPIFVKYGVTLLCLFLSIKYISSKNNDYLLTKNIPIWGMALSFVLIIFMGMRPNSVLYFCDSDTYKWGYENIVTSKYGSVDFEQEWFFGFIGTWCKSMQFSYVGYFLVIEIGYIGFMLIANWKLLWENLWMALLFAFSAYSFFTYGTNGLRNGLACSMVTAAVAFVATSKQYGLAAACGLCLLAVGVHRSTMLPIMALLASVTVVKDTKTALYFWIASIPISLVAGGAVTEYFSSWEFDERMASYGKDAVEGTGFSHVGFRWDFLLYSAMPVWLISYIVFQRDIKDRAFHVISTVYLLSNAFWVMVCRANYSNRFAYLSWFIYPLVIAYAVIRLPIWKDQDMRAGYILLAHAGFTMFMFLIGK